MNTINKMLQNNNKKSLTSSLSFCLYPISPFSVFIAFIKISISKSKCTHKYFLFNDMIYFNESYNKLFFRNVFISRLLST